jgi:hypothetical protein
MSVNGGTGGPSMDHDWYATMALISRAIAPISTTSRDKRPPGGAEKSLVAIIWSALCRIDYCQLHRSGDEAAWLQKLNIDPLPGALEALAAHAGRWRTRLIN